MPAMKGHVDIGFRVRLVDVLAALRRRVWGSEPGRKGEGNMSLGARISEDDHVHARRALERLRTLDDNWDREGGRRISKSAVDRALAVLTMLQRDLPAPAVAAMRVGGVELAWVATTRAGRLEIEMRFDDEGDTLLVGLAHKPGFIVEEQFDDPRKVTERVREEFAALTR
jgi:hypothetical protein